MSDPKNAPERIWVDMRSNLMKGWGYVWKSDQGETRDGLTEYAHVRLFNAQREELERLKGLLAEALPGLEEHACFVDEYGLVERIRKAIGADTAQEGDDE